MEMVCSSRQILNNSKHVTSLYNYSIVNGKQKPFIQPSVPQIIRYPPVKRTKRVSPFIGPMSETTYSMLYRFLEGNSDNDPDHVQFGKQYRKVLYKDGNTKKSIYHFIETQQGNSAIGKCDGGRMKEVVHKQREIEIVESIHRRGGKGCRPGRQKLVRKTCMEKYCISGIAQIVNDVLASCTGTCKETIRLSVQHPPPTPISTSAVMERIQIDITKVYGPSSPFLKSASHPYCMILVIKDCFSKFCWLTPMKNKQLASLFFIGVNKQLQVS